MTAVWVAELDYTRPGASGSWMGVHETRDGARLSLGEYAHAHGMGDLWPRARERDLATASEVASSTSVKDGDCELTYVINRYVVNP